MWKMIEGYDHPYRVNESGEFQHVKRHSKGEWEPLVVRDTGMCPTVKLRLNGVTVCRSAAKIVMDLFCGGSIKGRVPVHIDGDLMNIAAENLFIPLIEKVDSAGTVLAVYQTVEEAAKENYCVKSTVQHDLSGWHKNPFRNRDFAFRYEEVPHVEDC